MFEDAGGSADFEAWRRAAAGDGDAAAWAKGAEGERRVAMTLETLEAHGVVAIHDRLLRRDGRANIDHIAVGPPGVYVIDAKYYDGCLWVGDRAARVNNIDLAEVLRGARRQAAHVAEALRAAGLDVGWVTPVVCLVGTARPAGGRKTCYGVELVDARGLRRLLRESPARLDSGVIHRAVATIERAFPAAGSPGPTASFRPRPADLSPPRPADRRPSRPVPRRPAARASRPLAPRAVPWVAHGRRTTSSPSLSWAIGLDVRVRSWPLWARILAWWFAWPVLGAARIVAHTPDSTAGRVLAASVLIGGGAIWYLPGLAT